MYFTLKGQMFIFDNKKCNISSIFVVLCLEYKKGGVKSAPVRPLLGGLFSV